MNEAFETNWQAIGLPDRSPFDILSRCRAKIKPSKAPKRMPALRDNTSDHFNTPITTREESDRTASIRMGVV